MSLEDNTTCALCLIDFIDEDEVRAIHPTQGLVFPVSHTFPDGLNASGGRIPGDCRDNCDEPHIHDKCVAGWEDKFNLKTPETREEAAETAGIPRFSVFGLSTDKYTPDELAEIFAPDEDEEGTFSEIFDSGLEEIPITDMDDYADEALDAMASEMEEEDQEEDCPVGCPHKLYLHKQVTDQVLLCSVCDCSF